MNEDKKQIALHRVMTMPSDIKLAVDGNTLDREDIESEIKGETKIGKLIVRAHIQNLQSFKQKVL